jgi:hypothetical protein
MDVREQINNNLQSFFDTNDDNYQVVFCDKDGSIIEPIEKPTDIEYGAVASMLEYTRRLSQYIIDQLFLDRASEDTLKLVLVGFFSTPKEEGESIEDWIERVVAKVFAPKVSKAALIVALRKYSTQEPEIDNIANSGMFASHSFASRYRSYVTLKDGQPFKVFPARARSFDFSIFTIKIILYGTLAGQMVSVLNTIDETIAAGITYELEIKEA